MSVIVMGMEMPIGCDGCKLRYRHQGAYVTDHCFYNMKIVDPWTFGRSRNGDKPDWCPLRPLPEKHGRLILDNNVPLKVRFRGEERTYAEWSEILGVKNTTLRSRVSRGIGLDGMHNEKPTIVEAEGD